ncbi:hypothetical protein DFA_12317 [Cavenderia fasciculata]|uniref:Uncharacterized protein n=1 Tax=Cavenderia fasciculata TaxID=261658 RepID=F4QD70_CACFS|nr:uncharacterized protein DFA_12317 [Cavenderia fasciculata]EGG14541.1 hypothetical protein DFA_12317 [Cavenderia fasciculata]|eukprot:XP_004366061.1 hypothetical protein DFA_12317 [Cavenderia fasciculata]
MSLPHLLQSQIIREFLNECNVFSLPTNSYGLQYVCKRWFQLISHLPRTILVNQDKCNIQPFLTCLERMSTTTNTLTTSARKTKGKQSTDRSGGGSDQDQDDCWNLAKNVTYLIWDIDTYKEKKQKVERICRLLHNCPTITHIKTNHQSLSLFEKKRCLPKNLVHFAAQADDVSRLSEYRLKLVYSELAQCPLLVSIDIEIFSSLGRDPKGEIEDDQFFKPLTLCTNLVSLQLYTYPKSDMSLINEVLTANPNLTKLSLNIEGTDHQVLYDTIFAHPSLQSLQINFEYAEQDQVDDFIKMLPTKNTKITNLAFNAYHSKNIVSLFEALSAESSINQLITHVRIGAWDTAIQSSITKCMETIGSLALKRVTVKGPRKDPIQVLLRSKKTPKKQLKFIPKEYDREMGPSRKVFVSISLQVEVGIKYFYHVQRWTRSAIVCVPLEVVAKIFAEPTQF